MGPTRIPSRLYAPSVWLLTDLYQLTMADTFRRTGVADQQACFHLTFRRLPFSGGFVLACGLEAAIDFLRHVRPSEQDLEFLASLTGPDGAPLFDRAFLDWLSLLRFRFDVDAVPEGTAVFPYEPILRVVGPLAEAQLVESALCNLIGFPSLIATKAARVCLAARGDPVVEFGMRRAQGIDGAITASRAAWIGGCESTSHVLAGRLFGEPLRGTHAHSFVLAYPSEAAAFHAQLARLPEGAILLVDTHDTLQGARTAVRVARDRGVPLAGVRLDSGDLATLSGQVRRILDEGGFPDARILASGDLDEHAIDGLKSQGARIDAWGVGTHLMTGHPDAALGVVYKLSALREAPGKRWRHRLKRSDQRAKSTVPGILQVRRFRDAHGFLADAIFDELLPPPESWEIVDPADPTRREAIAAGAAGEDLLVPVLRRGQREWEAPRPEDVRRHAREQLDRLPPGVKRLRDPRPYPAGLERSLHELRHRALRVGRGGRTGIGGDAPDEEEARP